MNVGTLELSLLLNRTQFDRTLKEAERDAKLFENTKFMVTPQVDHKPLQDLNRHFDLKQQHHDRLNRHFRANPLTPQVDLSQLQQVHEWMSMASGGTISIEVKSQESKVKSDRNDSSEQLERAIADNLSPIRDLLEEIAGNTKPKGVIGRTVDTLFEGAIFGTTQAATRSFGEGISRGVERYFKTDFNRQGQALGLGTGRNVSKANKIADVASRELLGMPNGIKDLQRLATNPVQKAFNNFTDPKFYREIEDLIVYFGQKSGNADEQKINQELLDKARGKIQARFIAQVEEDIIRVMGAMLTLSSHPVRIRKRIQLGESAQQAKAQEELFRSEYEATGIKERIEQADSILHFVGGVAPNESKPGAPAVGTTHSMAAALQAIFPNAFVDTTTPYNTVDSAQIQQGLYHQIVRENILPFLKQNKDFATSVMGDEAYNNVINNLGQLHPIDAILQQNIDKGYNPDSVRLATKALASAQAFPEKDITLASASGGGFIVEEAIAILNELAKRYPELQAAVKRIKGFAIGTPMAGLTQTSRSGDKNQDLAEFKAYIGNLDKVGKGFFGSSLYQGLDPNSKEFQTLEGELGLPPSTITPDLNLQTVIKDWGLDHLVGDMIADLGKPISKFIVLLADFLNGNNQLKDSDAQNIVELFNQAQNLKLGESFQDYVAEVSEIVYGIARINQKIGGQIDVNSLKELSSKLRKLPELDAETAAKIPEILTGTLTEGIGINKVRGLGARSNPGKQALIAVSVTDLIKDIVNQISKARGSSAIFPEAEFDALDPNIADITTIDSQIGKSALELNLPVGDSGSLVQLWRKRKAGEAPVRAYQDEFQELWNQVLLEVQKIVELDPSQKERLFAEDGALEQYNFLWDAAGIAAIYKQPTYAEMHQQYQGKDFTTPLEKQYEKALLAFFNLYEKEAEIYKRDYLEPIKSEKEAYNDGDPEAATRLQSILEKSKFSNIADIAKRAKTATNKSIAKKQILGSNTDYDRYFDFINKFVEALGEYEAGNRQNPEVFQNLAKEGFGISPQIDYLLAQATTGTGRIPENIKAEDIKADTTIALPHAQSVIEGIFQDLINQGIVDLENAANAVDLQSINVDAIYTILEKMLNDLNIEPVIPTETLEDLPSVPSRKAKTEDNNDKYTPQLEVDNNPFQESGGRNMPLGSYATEFGSNPLVPLHENTNDKLDQIISILMGVNPDTPLPEVDIPEAALERVAVGQEEVRIQKAEGRSGNLELTSDFLKSFINGVIENFDKLFVEAQKWEKAFLDLAPGQLGHVAKKATQYTALPIAATFAAQGIPGLEQAIGAIHGLADLGLHDMAQGMANGVMDSISRTMPDAFGTIMDQLSNTPVVGDYFEQLRQIPQAIANSTSDYIIGNSGRTLADIGIGSGIIKGGKDAYNAVGNKLNPRRLSEQEQAILDRVSEHLSVEYKKKPITASSPEITAELEGMKLEDKFKQLEEAASSLSDRLQKLFTVEGLRRLAPMVDVPTTTMSGDKPIKSGTKNDIANTIARMASNEDIERAIANASPQMFKKEYQGMGKIKPEVDQSVFDNLKKYWQEAITEINSTPLNLLDLESKINTLQGFSIGYVNLLHDKELTDKQRQSAGSIHGQTKELETALKAYAKFADLGGLVNELNQKFGHGASEADKHWGNTADSILKNFRILVAEAKTKGYDIQRFISEGSPGPTERIRDNYEKTSDSVIDDLSEIENVAKDAGKNIEKAFTFGDYLLNPAVDLEGIKNIDFTDVAQNANFTQIGEFIGRAINKGIDVKADFSSLQGSLDEDRLHIGLGKEITDFAQSSKVLKELMQPLHNSEFGIRKSEVATQADRSATSRSTNQLAEVRSTEADGKAEGNLQPSAISHQPSFPDYINAKNLKPDEVPFDGNTKQWILSHRSEFKFAEDILKEGFKKNETVSSRRTAEKAVYNSDETTFAALFHETNKFKDGNKNYGSVEFILNTEKLAPFTTWTDSNSNNYIYKRYPDSENHADIYADIDIDRTIAEIGNKIRKFTEIAPKPGTDRPFLYREAQIHKQVSPDEIEAIKFNHPDKFGLGFNFEKFDFEQFGRLIALAISKNIKVDGDLSGQDAQKIEQARKAILESSETVNLDLLSPRLRDDLKFTPQVQNQQQVRTLKFASENPLSELEQRFGITAEKSQKHWADTATEILKQFDILAAAAKEKGYDIQRFISEGSPGTTERIRKYWEHTEKALSENIEHIRQESQKAGSAIEQLFSANPEVKNDFEAIAQEVEKFKELLSNESKLKVALELAADDDEEIGDHVEDILKYSLQGHLLTIKYGNLPDERLASSVKKASTALNNALYAPIAAGVYPDPWARIRDRKPSSYASDEMEKLQTEMASYSSQLQAQLAEIGVTELPADNGFDTVNQRLETWAKQAEEIAQRVEAIKARNSEVFNPPSLPESQSDTSEKDSEKANKHIRYQWNKTTVELLQRIKSIKEASQQAGSDIAEAFAANPELGKDLEKIEQRLQGFQNVLKSDYKLEVAADREGVVPAVEDSLGQADYEIGQLEAGAEILINTGDAQAGFETLGQALANIHGTSLDTQYVWQRIADVAANYARHLQESDEDPLQGLENVYDTYASAIDNLPNMGDIFSGVSEFIDEMSAASPIFENMVGFVKDLGISALAIFGFEEFSDVIVAGVQELIEYGREFQRFDRAMSAAGKSGQQVFDELYDRSQEFGTSFKESMAGYTQLSLGVQGTANEGLVDVIFPGFQKAFASRQSSPEQQGRGYLAIEQILSKGNASAEELRQQLSEALPGAFATAAQSMGMNMQEFTERLYSAQIAGDELMTRLSAFYEVDSEVLLKISSQSFEAELARAQNNLDYFQTKSGEIIIPVLTPGLQAANIFLGLLSENIEIVTLILGGVFLKTLTTVLASMWNVATATKINTVLIKGMGLEYALQTARMTSLTPRLTAGIMGVANAAKFMWSQLIAPMAVIGAITKLFSIFTAGSKEIKATAKIAKEIRQEVEAKDKDDKGLKPNKTFRSPNFFSLNNQLNIAKDAAKDTLYPTRWFSEDKAASQRIDIINIEKSINQGNKTIPKLIDDLTTTDFLSLKPQLTKVSEDLMSVSVARQSAVENSQLDKLPGLDQQKAALAELQKGLFKQAGLDEPFAKRELERIETQKQYLETEVDKELITEEKFKSLTQELDKQKVKYEAILQTIDAIRAGLTTTITEDFANIADNLNNALWAFEGKYTALATEDLQAKLAGKISSLELETREVDRALMKARDVAQIRQGNADSQQQRILADDTSLKKVALSTLGLYKYDDLSKLSNDKINSLFQDSLGKISNLDPKFIADQGAKYTNDQPSLSKFLVALSEWSQAADDAAIATNEVAQAENDRASKLKENAASYRDFAISLRDFYRSLEDIQIERQRFAEDFPRDVADVFLSVNRSARDLTEQYDDFIGNLDKNILQTQLEIAQLDKQIKNTKLRNDVRSKFAPGSQGFGTDLANLYLDYIDSLESEEEIGLQKNIKRLDVEDQILQFSQQIRDLSEQRESFERDRLEQLRGLLRQQEDYNLQQQRTWEDTLEQWQDIEMQAKDLGIELGVTANDVQTEGTNLVSAIATLSSKILEISDRLYAESKNKIAPQKSELRTQNSEVKSSSPYSASALESLREPPADKKPNFLDRLRPAWKWIGDKASDAGEFLFGKPANASTVPAGAKFIDLSKEAEEIQRRADENRKKNKKKKSESNPTLSPAPVNEYKVPEPVQKVINYGVNTPGGQAIGKVWKAVDVVTDKVPVIKDIKNQVPNVVNNVTKGVQTFIKDPMGTVTDLKNDALNKFGESPLYDGAKKVNNAIESLKEKAGQAIQSGAQRVDDTIEKIPGLGGLYKGGKDILNKWNPFNRSSLEKPLNFAWGNEMAGNQYASLGSFYQVASHKSQVTNSQSKLVTRDLPIVTSEAAPEPINLIKKEDVEKLEGQTKQESLPVLEPTVDFSQKEAEVNQKKENYYDLLNEKYQKEIELLDLSNTEKKRNFVDDAARKFEEIDQFFLQQGRDVKIQDYEVERQSANAKGYLTIPEQVRFAGKDVGQEYQNRINSLEDELFSLTKLFIDLQGTIATFSQEQFKDDPEAQKLLATAKGSAKQVAELIAKKESQKKDTEDGAGTAITVAETNKKTELDFQRRDEQLGVRSQVLEAKRERSPNLIQQFSLNKEAREIGEAQINLDFEKQLKQFDYLKDAAGNATAEYDKMKGTLEELRDVSLANLAEETNSLVQVFDEVAKPALNGLLDDFIDTSVTAEEAWRNFAASVLKSLADILMSYAYQELLNVLFPEKGQEQGGAQQAQSGGGDLVSTAINVGAKLIPTIFSHGGDTDAMYIPHASHGLDTSDVALARGLKEAIAREAHPEAFPAVLHKGEVVLSDLTGDAQLVRSLKSSGEWNRMKSEGYQKQKVENFRYGSEGMGAMSRSGGKTVINNYASVTVHAKDADSFKRTDNQIHKDLKLRQERSRR